MKRKFICLPLFFIMETFLLDKVLAKVIDRLKVISLLTTIDLSLTVAPLKLTQYEYTYNKRLVKHN